MYQPWLLLVELIVLAVTIYFFMMTRRAATDAHRQTEEMVIKLVKQRTEAHNTAMARDVATLVKEIEETAAEMRVQWTRQSIMLQDALKRVEAAEDAFNAPPPIEAAPVTPVAPAAAPAPARAEISGDTLGDALTAYRRHLAAVGRSAAAVSRSVGYVKAFALWWGGKRFERVQLRRINHSEADDYFDELQSEGLQPDTIRRKMNAVRDFLEWLDAQLQLAATPAASPPTAAQNGATATHHRHEMVKLLAQKGLDVPGIAAKTGLERETVRILLRKNA